MPLRALVLDYIAKSESPHEGKIVYYMLKNIGWVASIIAKPTREKLLEALFKAWRQDLIHISAHGNSEALSVSAGNRGIVTVDDIRNYFLKRLRRDEIRLDETLLVVNSGCDTASEKWADLFLDSLRVRHYIGVEGSPALAEGIIFPIIIYSELWGQQKKPRVKEAFKSAKQSLRHLEGTWKLYDKSGSYQ
jgi:hypothetical protein